jgi:pimeloyl-ACP methyl ester carboxylesterase
VTTGGEAVGSRPDLVLVHGLGSAGSYWDNLLPYLEDSFTVHSPELPGHGPRSAPVPDGRAHPGALARTLVEQLESDGVEQPHLVGLSLGGWVVLEMAAVGYGASVVALAPAGLWQVGAIAQDRKERTLRHALSPVQAALPLLARFPPVVAAGLEPNVAHPERVSTEQFVHAATALAQAKGYRTIDRALVRDRFTEGSRIAVPVTVAFGDHDRVLPADRARDLSELPAHADVHVVESCGHAMTWDQPEACLGLIAMTVDRASEGRDTGPTPG